jgi:LemA protein
MDPLTIVLVALGLGVILWVAWTFNGLISLRNRMRAAWGDVDALLKRRADLIPNLVAAVSGYLGHEERTLTEVTEARVAAQATRGGPEQRAAAENALTARVRQLLAVVENYPDLRASVNVLDLQAQLTETEDDLASARRYYNAVVRDYNTRRERFPDLLLAGPLGFRGAEFFELVDLGERAAPAADVRPDAVVRPDAIARPDTVARADAVAKPEADQPPASPR